MKPENGSICNYDITASAACQGSAAPVPFEKASPAAAAAGYADLGEVLAAANMAQVQRTPFDMSRLAGHSEAGYYRTHHLYQLQFRDVLDEMSRRHCRMPYAASKYDRAHTCGDSLTFAVGGASERATLALAFRCGLPLCPVCEASRSHKRLIDLSDALLWIQAQRASAGQRPVVALMLTETLPNCTGAQLPAYIDLLFDAHNRLFRYKAVSSVVLGTARSFEITHNREDDYHPHLHTLVLVDESYFSKQGGHSGYLSQREWAALHYKAVKAACKSSPIAWSDIQQPEGQTFSVHIERAFKRGSDVHGRLYDALTSAGREATKYVCKPDELMCKPVGDFDPKASKKAQKREFSMDWACDAIETVSCAIKNRTRYTSSGLFREALAALGRDMDSCADDDIGAAVKVPRSERVPDVSGVAYAIISQAFDASDGVRDYVNTSVFATGSPDDDGPLGGKLAQRAAANMAKRARAEKRRQEMQDGSIVMEYDPDRRRWVGVGRENTLPADYGMRELGDDFPMPDFDAPASAPAADFPDVRQLSMDFDV
jgi:hypothetical protein